MAEWWETAYPGGPAVTSIDLPRPLYPVGAPGYTPSDPGIDIKAAKRIISRAGRWPWVSGGDFSTEYTKEFSKGKAGGNVSDSGIAGYQRQMNIEPTGYVGTETYNSWRNARVPAGLPNAGQPIMDATAINMMGEAYQTYNGTPTPPPSNKAWRVKALDKAITQIGVKESPRGSNRCMYSEWYGMTGPWCAMFCTWCFEQIGDHPTFVRGSRYAYVPYVVIDARNVRYGLSLTTTPIPGDLVCYDWDGGEYDHIGIFENGTSARWSAIEGNTSTGNNSNGGEVMRRNRTRSSVARVAFVRVTEP